MQTTILCAVGLLIVTCLQADADSRIENMSPADAAITHVIPEESSGKSRQLAQTTERSPIDAIFNAFRSLSNSYKSGDSGLILQPVHLTIDEVFNAVKTFPQTYNGGQKPGQLNGPRTRRPPIRPRQRERMQLTSRPEYVVQDAHISDSNQNVNPKKCRPRQRGCQPAEDNGQANIKDVPANVLPQGESSYVQPLEVAPS